MGRDRRRDDDGIDVGPGKERVLVERFGAVLAGHVGGATAATDRDEGRLRHVPGDDPRPRLAHEPRSEHAEPDGFGHRSAPA